jgi:hypothetical protein
VDRLGRPGAKPLHPIGIQSHFGKKGTPPFISRVNLENVFRGFWGRGFSARPLLPLHHRLPSLNQIFISSDSAECIREKYP